MLDRVGASRMALAIVVLALGSPAGAAQWIGKGEAGLAFANGNTRSSTANARVAVTRKSASREYSFGAGGLYVRADGDTTARRWDASTQTRQDFIGRNFWHLGVRYEEDRFSGFDHQGVVTSGVGRRFVDNDRTRLLMQVGAGFKFYETLGDTMGGDDAGKADNITFVSTLEFQHRLTDTTTLLNKFGSEVNSGNTFLQNEVAVAVKMTDRLALSVAYAVRLNTDPPDTFKRTDRLTTANLVYEVK
jgi:putative salt-induced outer membrane protein